MEFFTKTKIKAAGALLCCALLAFSLPAVSAQASTYTPEADSLADTYLVMDAATGQVLVASGAEVAKYPASITKIVTLALVQQAINAGTIGWDTGVAVSQSAMDALIPGASTAGLMVGEVVSVRDLVMATQIKSANEAANVLAELVGGSIEGFAAMMNAKVAELGLTGTHFTNPSGLPDKSHYTTAYDMGQLTRWALTVPGFTDIYAARDYIMPPTNMYNGERGFNNSNSLLAEESDYYLEGVVGSKSGYTDAAAYTLVTAAERDGMQLVCVVLRTENNDDKYVVTTELMEYCFANFGRVEYTMEAINGAKVPVYGGGDALGDVTVEGADSSVSFLLHNGLSLDDVNVDINIPERYVIGQDFSPSVRLTIGDGTHQYTEAIGFPLAWSGLEEVFAANTNKDWSMGDIRTPVDYSGVFDFLRGSGVVVVLVLAFAILGIGLRIVYVQYRRRKITQRKLMEQRTAMAQKRAALYRQPQVAPRAPAARNVKNPAANQRRPAANGPRAVHLTVVSHQRTGSARPATRPAPRAGQR